MYTPCMLLHVYASVCALLYDPPYLPPTHTTTPWLWLRSEWFLASLLKIFGSSSISVTASWMKHDYHHLLHHPQNNNHTNKTSLSVCKQTLTTDTYSDHKKENPPISGSCGFVRPQSAFSPSSGLEPDTVTHRTVSHNTAYLISSCCHRLLSHVYSFCLFYKTSSVMFTSFVCFTTPDVQRCTLQQHLCWRHESSTCGRRPRSLLSLTTTDSLVSLTPSFDV